MVVVTYIDDLVISGEKESVQNFKDLQHQVYQVPHLRAPCRVLGQNHKEEKVRSGHMEFSQQLIDNLLGLLDVKGRVTRKRVSRFSYSRRRSDQV